MAPEVIDAGLRGYGMKADIWSLGCTVVEMATGRPPFYELGSPQAAIFKVGLHKAHPDIPKTMSDTAKDFLKRCFEPDPAKRSSAAELLDHPFIAKNPRPKSTDRRPRNTSADELQNGGIYKRSYSTPVHPEAVSHPMDTRPRGTSMTSSGSRQSYLSVEIPEPASPTNNTASSGCSSDTGETFNQLKSHQKTQAEVVQLLTDNRDEVCSSWEKCIADNSPRGFCPVSKDQLYQMIDGFRDYFSSSQNEKIIEKVIGQLIGRDSETNGLKQALLNFRDVTSNALKKRGTKPHSIFAVNNLVKTAVSLALIVLAPENSFSDVFESPQITVTGPDDDNMKAHPDGKQEVMPVSASSPHVDQLQSQVQLLTEENMKLMRELIEVQEALKQQLQANLTHHKRMLAEQSSPPSSSAGTTDQMQTSPDAQLVQWLQSVPVGEDVIQKFVLEEFTFEDVTVHITYQDLCRLDIKGGPRCRIWGAIQRSHAALT